MTTTYRLGGRDYVPVTQSTLEHDLHYLKLRTRAGFDHLEKIETESWDDYAVRLLDRVVATGQILPLLGCLLIPAGTDPMSWTPELGRETAERLGRIGRPGEKDVVRALALSLLLDFFEHAPASLPGSRTSSADRGAPPPGSTGRGRDGRSSFWSFLTAISDGCRRSCGHLFRKPFTRSATE